MAICMHDLTEQKKNDFINEVPKKFGKGIKVFCDGFVILFLINVSLLMISTIKNNLLKLYLSSSSLIDHYQDTTGSLNKIFPKLYWSLFAESTCYIIGSILILFLVFYTIFRSFTIENR